MQDDKGYKTALSKAMVLCSRIEYCRGDIRKKLQSWGVPSNDEDRIISTLIEENFINEKRYAKAFVRDKFSHNKWGKVKIEAQLKAKDIPAEITADALGEIDIKEYMKVINNLIASHRRSVKSNNQYELKGKLLRYGLSKGFESNLLYDLLNNLDQI